MNFFLARKAFLAFLPAFFFVAAIAAYAADDPGATPKPQVVYHVPRESIQAAADLHAQSKAAALAAASNRNLDVTPDMPVSLQLARAAANAEAVKAATSAAPSSPQFHGAQRPQETARLRQTALGASRHTKPHFRNSLSPPASHNFRPPAGKPPRAQRN